MTPLIKKHSFDLGRIQDVYVDAIKVLSDKGEIYGLPYFAQLNALFYNKNIFDKFGVPYPKDGMTWDDAVELAKKVTRMDSGTQIQGLNYTAVHRLAFPFSPNFVDPKTLEINVNSAKWSPVWTRAFQYGKQFDSIPGNSPNKDFNKGEVAMWAGLGDHLPPIKKAVSEGAVNLGVVQYPQFKEAPNTYGMIDAHYAFVLKSSQNQDAAMKIVETMLSDEVQLNAAKVYGRLSTLKNPEMQKQFGAEFLPGVDMQSIFKSKPAPGTTFHELYPKGRDAVLNEYKLVANGTKDINTALRNAEDTIKKAIEEFKSSKK
jgi:multiple sugar transport system substrate-binding protein